MLIAPQPAPSGISVLETKLDIPGKNQTQEVCISDSTSKNSQLGAGSRKRKVGSWARAVVRGEYEQRLVIYV